MRGASGIIEPQNTVAMALVYLPASYVADVSGGIYVLNCFKFLVGGITPLTLIIMV